MDAKVDEGGNHLIPPWTPMIPNRDAVGKAIEKDEELIGEDEEPRDKKTAAAVHRITRLNNRRRPVASRMEVHLLKKRSRQGNQAQIRIPVSSTNVCESVLGSLSFR
jgi:hypothetical protein